MWGMNGQTFFPNPRKKGKSHHVYVTGTLSFQTPMNQASSRSHCIFTVHVTARETGSATIRRAKLHLVDLAG